MNEPAAVALTLAQEPRVGVCNKAREVGEGVKN